MSEVDKLMSTSQPFLTDGGFETWMFFVEGFHAPEFAAILLMDDETARKKMRAYFDRFLSMAADASTGFVLDTNTWRGCVEWAPALGISPEELLRLSRKAVDFAHEIRSAWAPRVNPILVNGVIGPAGDGYVARNAPNPADAAEIHLPQVIALAEQGVDMISAITMTNSDEAIGIVRGVASQGLLSVVSFTVETNGILPSGESLAQAITATDLATNGAPLYYMVNCAHPDHFSHLFKERGQWLSRIGGLRANASRKSHAELDEAEELDDGNPVEFGQLHIALDRMLPNLRVIGGCCGTDHRHVGCISSALPRMDLAGQVSL